MTEFNRQEIFNKAYEGLRAQKFKRSVKNGTCAYRGPRGLKCALGHLIPDDRYSPEMEGNSPFDERIHAAVDLRAPVDFLDQLQGCHDKAMNAREVKLRLEAFAKDYSLTVPVSS